MSAFGLTRTTELTLAEAENYIKAYFEHFPKVKAWLDNTRVLAAKQGYVETLLGRRRYFPNLQTGTNYAMRQREEREAINAPFWNPCGYYRWRCRAPGAFAKAG